MLKALLFLILLAGISGYYEYTLIKGTKVTIASQKFSQDSQKNVILTLNVLITNPSDISLTVSNITGSISLGANKVGTITLPNPVIIAAKGSSSVSVSSSFNKSVLTWSNLMASLQSSINFDFVVSGKVIGISITNLEFQYTTSIQSMI